ncbi:hypothetical protein K2X33_07185 [bacterium]|nr:hypothetical protein [bacterium]
MRILKLLLVFSLLAQPARAEIGTDKFAHFGMSFALMTATYGISKQLFRIDKRDRFDAVVLGVVTTLVVGFAIEVADSMARKDRRLDGGDLLADSLGVATSTLFIYSFDL